MNPDDIKEPEMKMFSISLCLSIEAESEQGAIEDFYEKVSSCAFDRDSVEIERENDE